MAFKGRIKILQSCDPDSEYKSYLQASHASLAQFCSRNRLEYSCYIGVKRGSRPWHASYNRIILLKELLDFIGFDGWVVYLDADALVSRLDWDIRAFLEAYQSFSCLVAFGGPPTKNEYSPTMFGRHDQLPLGINNGVMFYNFRSALCRRLIDRWYRSFLEDVSDEYLGNKYFTWEKATEMALDDQALLRRLIETDPELYESVFVDYHYLINHQRGKYIKQFIRVLGTERLLLFKEQLAEVAKQYQSMSGDP